MAEDTSSPYKKERQLLKRRKTDRHSISNDGLSNNVQTSEEAYINANDIKEEKESTPVKTRNNSINLRVNNSRIDKRRTVSESYNNNQLTNGNGNCLISIRKLEDLCKTPEKSNHLYQSTDSIDIKDEIFSPVRVSPRNVKIASTKKKKHHEDDNKFTKRKKRKINDAEDDQLSDLVKTELYENNVNDMEHIEMLHDLDTVMDFEDTKIPNFLCSTTNDLEDEHITGIIKDPQTDPLLIDVNDIFDGNTGNKRKRQEKRIVKSECSLKKRANEVSNVTDYVKTNLRPRLNNKKLCDTPIGIKDALGKLYIDSDAEEEEVIANAEQKLYNLKVQLMHTVPLQHQIERSAGSRSLSKLEKNLFLKYTSLKKGSFLPKEDEIILNNWKKFCEVHNWNPKFVKPFVCVKNGNKYYIRNSDERQKFVQFLANGLPCRSLYSILQRFKIIFEKFKKSCTRYSLEEDEIILSYIKKHRRRKKHNNFSILATMLSRKRHSIWLRYHTLKNMQNNKKQKSVSEIQWTLELIGQFIQNLMNIMLCEKVTELKDAIIPKPVWVKLEQKLNIDYRTLKEFWILQLHMQLFCSESIYLNDIKIKLIEYMYGKGISNRREIVWSSVAKYFDGVTTIFLGNIFNHLQKETNKKLNTTNFVDIVDYLYNCKIIDIQNSLVDRFLPRLSYHNGNVKIIDEDTNY